MPTYSYYRIVALLNQAKRTLGDCSNGGGSTRLGRWHSNTGLQDKCHVGAVVSQPTDVSSFRVEHHLVLVALDAGTHECHAK